MPDSIKVYTRSVYGRTLIYAADKSQAQALRTLTNGATTLESRHIAALESLGFTVEQVPDPKSALPLSRLNSFA